MSLQRKIGFTKPAENAHETRANRLWNFWCLGGNIKRRAFEFRGYGFAYTTWVFIEKTGLFLDRYDCTPNAADSKEPIRQGT